MRKRILIAALVATGIWAAARFKPTSDVDAAGTGRKILLVEAAGAGAPVVSALEAGLATKLTLARPVVTAGRRAVVSSGTAGQSHAEVMHDHAAMAMAEPAPAMHMSTTSAAVLTPQSGSAALPVVQASGIALVFGSDQPEHRPAGPGFEPAIIIRGGMGGARDDCDLHRRRGGGVGIAINRSVPSFGTSREIGRTSYPSGMRLH